MSLYSAIRLFAKKIGNVIYPDHCIHCNNLCTGMICLRCEYQLRKYIDNSSLGNLFYSHFFNHLQVTFAASLFPFFKKGVFQTLIHALKYQSHKDIGQFIGHQMGTFLLDNECDLPDVIIPVPLHPKKERKRGYNQAHLLAKGLQEVVNIPIDCDMLVRNEHSRSQTTKSKIERISSLDTAFAVNHEKTNQYRHVLLIDDVITTGATLRACINALTRHKNIKISILVAGAGQ